MSENRAIAPALPTRFTLTNRAAASAGYDYQGYHWRLNGRGALVAVPLAAEVRPANDRAPLPAPEPVTIKEVQAVLDEVKRKRGRPRKPWSSFSLDPSKYAHVIARFPRDQWAIACEVYYDVCRRPSEPIKNPEAYLYKGIKLEIKKLLAADNEAGLISHKVEGWDGSTRQEITPSAERIAKQRKDEGLGFDPSDEDELSALDNDIRRGVENADDVLYSSGGSVESERMSGGSDD